MSRGFGAAALPASNPPATLIVCPRALGDLVLALPAIAEAARQLPEKLVVSAYPDLAELLSLLQPIVRIQQLQVDPLMGTSGPGELQQFDRFVLLGRHRKVRRGLDRLFVPPERVTVLNRYHEAGCPPLHLSQRFYDFVEASLGFQFAPFPGRIKRLLSVGAAPFHTPYLAVHPGNSSSLKRRAFWRKRKVRHRAWPQSHWIDLIEGLTRSSPARIVVTGGHREDHFVKEILGRLSSRACSRTVDCSGRTPLVELAGILAGARLFVGVDTGPTHLASILGTPTIALFGPTDPAQVGPLAWQSNLQVLRTGIACSPCNRAVRKTCRENRCLTELAPQRVLDLALETLQDRTSVAFPSPVTTP